MKEHVQKEAQLYKSLHWTGQALFKKLMVDEQPEREMVQNDTAEAVKVPQFPLGLDIASACLRANQKAKPGPKQKAADFVSELDGAWKKRVSVSNVSAFTKLARHSATSEVGSEV